MRLLNAVTAAFLGKKSLSDVYNEEFGILESRSPD